MSKTLSVAAREVRERWLLFPAGLVLGLNLLVLPSFGVDRGLMPVLSLVTAVLLGAAAAVMMGSTMLARDAANGRLAFLFSRPLSWPAIWGGKWLGALFLVTVTTALASIPFMSLYPSHGLFAELALQGGVKPAWAFVFGSVLGVGAANLGATAYRSRSPWLALDLALLVGGLWLARHSVAPLWRWGILGRNEWGLAPVLLPLAISLLAASAFQTARGRTDVRRAHHAMSLAFWAIVGLTLAAAGGYWRWVKSAGPAELEMAGSLTRDPAGRFVYIEGSAERGGRFGGGYPYAHLIDTASGQWATRPEPGPEWVFPPHPLLFSADGRSGVLPGSDGRGASVVLFDLATAPPRARHVSLESSPPPGWMTSFAVSASAASVFVAHESGASIFALPSGRRVATTTILPGWRPAATRFVDEGIARAWLVPHAGPGRASPRAEIRVVDLAVDGRSRTSDFPTASSFGLPFQTWHAVLPDMSGQRLVTVDGGVHLRNGATGELLTVLASPDAPVTTSFLEDGRLVVAESGSSGGDLGDRKPTLRVVDRDGTTLSEMPLDVPPGADAGSRVVPEDAPDLRPVAIEVGAQLGPGKVLVAYSRRPQGDGGTLVVDLRTGSIVDHLPALFPAWGWHWGPAASAARTDGGSVQFLQDTTGHVVRVDFGSGERTIATGPGAPDGERIRIGW